MGYEKKYNEALERARELEENSNGMILKKWLWQVFPELKESEDERIRQALIEYFQERDTVCDKLTSSITNKEVLTWLEKQGEQKETLCDKCRKTQPSHSCQDITALGRCAVEHEQKSADKVETFDKYEGLTDFERTLADICIGWIGEELGWKQYIKDNADVLLKIAIKKFNSIQDTQFEKKSANKRSDWSEEDNVRLQRIIDFLWCSRKGDTDTIYQQEQDIDWLKSLKRRMGQGLDPDKVIEWLCQNICTACYNEPDVALSQRVENFKKDFKL